MLRNFFCLAAIVAGTSTAIAQVRFIDDFVAAQEIARKDKKLVLLYLASKDSDDCKKIDTDFDANAKLAETMGRKFACAKLMAEDTANKNTLKRFDATKFPVFVVLDSDGRLLTREEGYQSPARFSAWIDNLIDLQTGLAMLEKADRTKPIAMVNALRKVSAAVTDRSYAVLVEAMENEELPDSVRKAAIEGLGKQKYGPEKLLAFLAHKNPTLKSAANSTVKQQGQSAASALIEGLASDNVDLRVASWVLMTPLVKDTKLIRSADFWKNGKAPDREKAVAALREWHKSKKD